MTTPGDNPSLDGIVAAARGDFLTLAAAALARLAEIAARIDGGDAAGELDAAKQELHRLQGSAGTFGFQRMTRQAAAAQLVVRRWRGLPAGAAPRGPVLLHVVACMRDELALAPGAARADNRRLLLSGLGDDAATDLALAALSAGLVVERVFKGELPDAMQEGAPLAVVTGEDTASASIDAIVAELKERMGGQVG